MAINSLPVSTSLLAEINALAPDRDKGADGTIGDGAHQAESSDHNPDDTPGSRTPFTDADSIAEVHARDVDSTGPWPMGWSMERIVQIIVSRHRSGQDDRLQNVIYSRRIWSRSWGWTQQAYTGSDPHTGHAHFSFRYGSGTGATNPENDTRPWGITAAREAEMALDSTDLANVRKIVNEEVARFVGDVVHRYVIQDGKVVLVPETDSNPRMMVSSALQYIHQTALQNNLALTVLLGTDSVDESAIISGVLAGLTTPDKTAEEIALALYAALNTVPGRAAEVGRLLTSVIS